MIKKYKSIHLVQILFVSCIFIGTQSFQLDDVNYWTSKVARYILYLLLIKGFHKICLLGFEIVRDKQTPDPLKIFDSCKLHLIVIGVATAILLHYKQKIFESDFPVLFIGQVITKYLKMEQQAPNMISYGMGMALSYVEGYLVHVIPSDGADMVGLVENMTTFENIHGILFPVKRLFIVITKSLYCPPDLSHFNRPNRHDLPYLQARQSLLEVRKDVAGTKNRTYCNSVYKICRPGEGPVSLVAECATPLHTLHRVTERRLLYEYLANVDMKQVVNDFCTTLQDIIDKTPDFRGKCELVYYDDTDANQNLADVLLKKICEIEPNFENIKRV